MQHYHIEVKGIPEYINMLEDAQRQAGRAGRTIADETLLLFASTAMLMSERFLRANDDWEERAERDKTWSKWKTTYKRAHTKARVKGQANDGSIKFGRQNWPLRISHCHRWLVLSPWPWHGPACKRSSILVRFYCALRALPRSHLLGGTARLLA